MLSQSILGNSLAIIAEVLATLKMIAKEKSMRTASMEKAFN